MLSMVRDWFHFNWSTARTLLANKVERFTYRPGRMDMTLLFSPDKQKEFEAAWLSARKTRAEVLTAHKAAYERALTVVHDNYAMDVRKAEAAYDRTMRALVVKFGAVPENEPQEVRRTTVSKSLGAAAEA